MDRDMEVAQTSLEKRPDGITEVTVGDMNCLAVSYLFSKVILFYDLEDMQGILHSYSVAPHRPGRLCTYLSNTILYEDHSTTPHIVRSLDCSTTSIAPNDSEFTNLSIEGGVHDMCCIAKGSRSYFVSTNGYKGVYCTNNESEELDWNVKGKLMGMKKEASLWGVTSDGRGHLLLCDTENKCIQMMSLTDGRYLGDVLREGEQGMGQPWRIHWCTKSASCYVVHKKGQDWCISVIEDAKGANNQALQESTSEDEVSAVKDVESAKEDMEDSEEESPRRREQETSDSSADKELSDMEVTSPQREDRDNRAEAISVKRMAPWQLRKLGSDTSPENNALRNRQSSENEGLKQISPKIGVHSVVWQKTQPPVAAQQVSPVMNEPVGARLLRIAQNAQPGVTNEIQVKPPNQIQADPWRSTSKSSDWNETRSSDRSRQSGDQEKPSLEDPWKKRSESDGMEDFQRRQPVKKAHSVPAPWEDRRKDSHQQPRSVSVPDSPEKRPWRKQNSAPDSEMSAATSPVFSAGPQELLRLGGAQEKPDTQHSVMSPVRQTSDKCPWARKRSRFSDRSGDGDDGTDKTRATSDGSVTDGGSHRPVAPRTALIQQEKDSLSESSSPETKKKWRHDSSDEESSAASPRKDSMISRSSKISQRWRQKAFTAFKVSNAAPPPKLLAKSDWNEESSESDSDSTQKETTFKRVKKRKENIRRPSKRGQRRDDSQDSDSDTEDDSTSRSRSKSPIRRRDDKFKSPPKRRRSEERKQEPAADFVFQEKESIDTQLKHVEQMCILSDGAIVACLEERGHKFLIMYDNKTGKQVASQKLKDGCDGLTEVSLGGSSTIAITSTYSSRINFYTGHRLELFRQRSVHPYRPERLCTSGSSMLIFVDKLHVLRWVDCSDTSAKVVADKTFTLIQQHEKVSDICCIKRDGEELIFTADKLNGVIAHNFKSNKREWSIKGKLPGQAKNIHPERIITNGNGQLFVIDRANECIQMLSANGTYLGILGQIPNMKYPREIGWCKKTSSIVVLHKAGGKCRIDRIQAVSTSAESSPRRSTSSRRGSQTSERSFRSAGDDRSPSSRSRISIDSDSDVPSTKKGRWDSSSKKNERAEQKKPDHGAISLEVAQSVNTEFSRVSFLSAGGRNKDVVFVYGRVVGEESWKLTKFSVRAHNVLDAVKLKDTPDGLAEVEVNGKPCIALSYKNYKRIDFHDVNDLQTKVQSHDVSPYMPGPLCKVNEGAILYGDHSRKVCRVHWLDCSNLGSKSSARKTSIIFGEDKIIDICFAQHKNQDLVIALLDNDGIFAYDNNRQKFMWRIDGKLSGMKTDLRGESLTADGDGNLFVSDYKNKCIQHFSLDGVYEKPVMKGESDSLSEPVQIRWCSRASALVVAHMKRRHYGISIIKKAERAGDTHLLLPFSES